MSLRIVFMGTPSFAVPSLRALVDAGHEIAGVFCQPDRPKGRGNKLEFCPVKQFAVGRGIPVFQPARIRLDGADALRNLHPDLCVTAAFGQILSEDNLSVPALGTVNVHASLLPKYRGSAPISWALINGEKTTGVTTMLTDKGLDTGDILLQTAVPVPAGITAGELTDILAEAGAELLTETVAQIEKGICPRQKQNEAEMSYYPMLTKETGHIDFENPADSIVHLIRGVSPWPGAYVKAGEESVKIWSAEAVRSGGSDKAPGEVIAADTEQGLLIRAGGDSALSVLELQLPGGKRMKTADYLRGHRFPFTRVE